MQWLQHRAILRRLLPTQGLGEPSPNMRPRGTRARAQRLAPAVELTRHAVDGRRLEARQVESLAAQQSLWSRQWECWPGAQWLKCCICRQCRKDCCGIIFDRWLFQLLFSILFCKYSVTPHLSDTRTLALHAFLIPPRAACK